MAAPGFVISAKEKFNCCQNKLRQTRAARRKEEAAKAEGRVKNEETLNTEHRTLNGGIGLWQGWSAAAPSAVRPFPLFRRMASGNLSLAPGFSPVSVLANDETVSTVLFHLCKENASNLEPNWKGNPKNKKLLKKRNESRTDFA